MSTMEMFLAPPQEWMQRGICQEIDPDLWFPEQGQSGRAAKQFCSVCPVLAECRKWALERDEGFGIWGGLSERERRLIKRRGAPPPLVPST